VSISSDHIPFTHLVDLVEGRLARDEQTRIEAHIAACPRCAAEVVWLQRVIGLMRTDDSVAPPPYVVAQARRMFRAPPERAAVSARQRIVAALQFDSARGPLAFGIRAGAPAERQILFSAAEYDLDLRVAPNGSLWQVSGQVLGTDDDQPAPPQTIELRSPAGALRATLNSLSEFTLPPAPAGSYTLALHLADIDIAIADLEIGV
jgi:hypothetical protein